MRSVIFTAALVFASACVEPVDPPPDEVPVLSPEPAGAPTAPAEGRMTCLGDNAPPTPSGSTLTLPGWVRTFADRENAAGAVPSARVEAFDPSGVSLAVGFSDSANGRVALTIPIRPSGFEGYVTTSADGYLETRIYSSRPYSTTGIAGWVWMLTSDEVSAAAGTAGETVDPGLGLLLGAVHDCDVFGVANAVVRVAGETSGVTYFDGFTPAPDRTATDAGGHFAVANLPPGPVTVEAFGRQEAGGPLILLSRADVEVTAGGVTTVDLQPRVGTTR